MRSGTARAEFILHELLQKGKVEVEALSGQLGVDSSTIRRDLEKLERQNLLRRVHGGAVPITPLAYTTYAHDLTFQTNLSKQVKEKTAIALEAARLIQPGDAIALSPGSTTTYLARTIRHLQIEKLTVVTNALNIAVELTGLRGINLIVIGGMLLEDFFAMVGPHAERSLSEIYIDKAFLGITGISPEHGLTGPNQLEAITHRATMQQAKQAIVLADHTKLGRVALYRVAPVNTVHTLISDASAPAEIVAAIKDQDVNVRLV